MLINFGFGILANFGSAFYLKRQYEPEDTSDDEKSQEDDPKGTMRKALKRFITYDALSEFAFHVSGPLMMVYWLRDLHFDCLLYTSPSPRDRTRSRMPSSA